LVRYAIKTLSFQLNHDFFRGTHKSHFNATMLASSGHENLVVHFSAVLLFSRIVMKLIMV